MRRIVLYGSVLTFARGVPVIAILAASWILPGDDFGVLAIYVTAITTASLLADSGTDSAATWFLSRSAADEYPRRFGALFSLRLASSLVLTIGLVWSQIPLWGPEAGELMWLVAILAVVANLLAGANAASRIELRISGSGERGRLLLEKCIAGIIFICVALIVGDDVSALLLAYPSSLIFGCVVAARWGRWPRPNLVLVPRLIHNAAPFIVSSISAAIVWRLPITLLAVAGLTSEAGYFALMSYPLQLFGSIAVFGSALLLVRRPENEGSSRPNLSGIALFACAITAALATAIWATNYIAPDLIFDRDAVLTGLLLAISLPALWLNPIMSASLRAEDHVWTPTLAHIAGAMIGAISLLVLLDTKPENIAIAVPIAEYSVCLILLVMTIRKRRGVS